MGNNTPPPPNMTSIPTRLHGAPSGFRGPRQTIILAAVLGASALLLGVVFAIAHAGGASDTAKASTPPLARVTPQAALPKQRGDAAAVVIADPMGSPVMYQFVPHFRMNPAAPPPTPQVSRVEIRQSASTDQGTIVPRLTRDEQRLVDDSPPHDTNETKTRYAMVMHLDTPPPSQDAQASADLGVAHAYSGVQTAQNDTNASSEGNHFVNHAYGGYAPATSEDELYATTTIACRLETEINSEIPGVVRSRVTMPVYDSHTHDHVVIPAGTIVAGSYSSHVIGGQSRLLVSWQRLYLPDGHKFDMGNQEGADALGAAGMVGRVDNHIGQAIRTGLMMTLFGVGTTLLNPPASILTTQSVGSSIGQAAGGELSQLSNRIASRQLEQGPTIRISPPYDFQIMLLDDLPLQRYAVQ